MITIGTSAAAAGRARALERLIAHGEYYRGAQRVAGRVDAQIAGVALLRSFPHGTPAADIVRLLEGEGVDCAAFRRTRLPQANAAA